MMLCSLALGHKTPWDTVEFEALRVGFDLSLNAQNPDRTLLERTRAFEEQDLALLFGAMFDRKPKGVKDIADHVRCVVSGVIPEDQKEYMDALAAIFQKRVLVYLEGVGHPPSCRDSLVDARQFEQDKDSSNLRCLLLLQASSDSDLMPFGSDWTIRFELTLPDEEANDAVPISWHTCLRSGEVTLSPAVLEILTKPSRTRHHAEWEHWFHSQLLVSCMGSQYTAL
ncbi:hypothetical protein NLJ89_g11259 [Agrocybe chaxingu]|uniref:Uncharacterized protein n=1 Tax=Agrocybe chaxingu TaxID=84603 RepID=A0A9W8MRT2_9AGAR|nr:hypothetical protein NLJ89_g11259 [Agrocybe chaxingu]